MLLVYSTYVMQCCYGLCQQAHPEMSQAPQMSADICGLWKRCLLDSISLCRIYTLRTLALLCMHVSLTRGQGVTEVLVTVPAASQSTQRVSYPVLDSCASPC